MEFCVEFYVEHTFWDGKTSSDFHSKLIIWEGEAPAEPCA